MAQIVLDHVDKVYGGGVKALDDLNLEVKEGEFMVLVGPSGCGKSTALRSIAGLEEITGGTISIGERVVNDLPPKDRDIAMVFQNYALYPHMTVEENLAFGLKLRHDPERGDQAAGPRRGQHARSRPVPEAQAGGAVRRPAAAGGDGPRDRARAAGVPDGRAAVEPGRQAAGVDAGRAEPAARPAGHHHRVRHPRPGRGDDARGPGVRAAATGACSRSTRRRSCSKSPVNLFVAGFIGSPAMNFVLADLVRDDGPAATFAGYRLPVPATVFDAKPGLDGYLGRKVIMGIRPSDFEDASLGDASWARLPVTVGVTEELGTEIHVIFTIDAPPVEHAAISSATERHEEEDEAVAALAGGKSLWTARVSVPVRRHAPGSRSSWPSTPRRLHFFDPASGQTIGHPLNTSATVSA